MTPKPHWLLAGAAIAALSGCATRTIPDLTSEASERPAPAVGIALREDPPLPGEPTAGWYGLAPEDTAVAAAEQAHGDIRTASARPGGNRLTVDAAVEIALRNNRELRAAVREVDVAGGGLTQAGTLPNPVVEVEGIPAHGEVEVAVEYPLTRALLAPARRSAAVAELDAARTRSKAAALQLEYDVRAAFYTAQAAQQKLALANRSLEASAAGRDASRALLAAGNVVPLETAIQEANYEAGRVATARAELEVVEAREALARVLGVPGDEGWTLEGELPVISTSLDLGEGAESRAIAASLELAEMRSRMEASAATARHARLSGWIPDVAVRAFGEKADHDWGIGGGVEVALPIFDRKQGTARAADASYEVLQERYHALARDIRAAVRLARSRLALANAQATHYGQVVLPAREKVMQQAMLQYNAMQVGVFQLIQVRREQLDGELNHVDSLRDYWTAAAAWDSLMKGRRVEAQLSAAPAISAGGGDEGGH